MSTPRNMGTRKRKRAQTVTDNTIKEDHKELIAALVPEVTKGVVSALQAMGVLGKNPNSSNPEVHQVEAVAETSSTSSATDNHSMPNNSDSIKQSKTVLPCTSLTFFGIELDSAVMEKRLPQDKLRKVRHLIQTYKARKTVRLQELQSIIGLLNFACSVVIPGRPFLKRLCDLTIGLTRPYHHRHLNSEARADHHR